MGYEVFWQEQVGTEKALLEALVPSQLLTLMALRLSLGVFSINFTLCGLRPEYNDDITSNASISVVREISGWSKITGFLSSLGIQVNIIPNPSIQPQLFLPGLLP